MEKKPTSKKKKSHINKSLKYYIIYGVASILLIIILLLIYAWIEKIDILAWFGGKYALIMYGAILIYLTIGIIIFVKSRIERM